MMSLVRLSISLSTSQTATMSTSGRRRARERWLSPRKPVPMMASFTRSAAFARPDFAGAVKMVGWMARLAEARETLRTKSRREVVIVVVFYWWLNIGNGRGFSIIFMEMTVMPETKPKPPYWLGLLGVIPIAGAF